MFDALWQNHEDIKQALNAIEPREGPVAVQDPKVDELGWELKRAAQAVLGHPYSFEHVRCWMVDAVGCQAECDVSKDLVAEMEEDALQGLGHKYMENFGALPTEVRALMVNWNLTDSGGGCNSWHLGCHCTEPEAKELCAALHGRFQHAIDKGMLLIRRTFWSLRLKDD